jgi:hypothetical protein
MHLLAHVELEPAVASIGGTHHKEKALHVAAHLERVKLLASSGRIKGFKRRHNIVYRTLS